MKRNVFLSFLGTSPYQPCRYRFPDEVDPMPEERFIQMACIRRFCRNWSDRDRVWIATTDGAFKKNGQTANVKEAESPAPPGSGLFPQLESLAAEEGYGFLQGQNCRSWIPAGKTIEEVWDLFRRLAEKFEPGDTLYLDITYSFRSIPLLSMAMLAYLRQTKSVHIEKVVYGAYEARDDQANIAPVFDLTPFAQLLEWIDAVRDFQKSGNGEGLQKLLGKELQPYLKKSRGRDRGASEARSLQCNLQKLTETIRINKLPQIATWGNMGKPARSLQQIAREESEPYLTMLGPLLEPIAQTLEPFKENDWCNGYRTAKWSWDHGMQQQAYTQLLETTVNLVLQQVNLGESKDPRVHSAVTTEASRLAKKTEAESEFDEWGDERAVKEEEREKIRRVLGQSIADGKTLAQIVHSLAGARNHYMHGHTTTEDNIKPQYLRKCWETAYRDLCTWCNMEEEA